MMETIIWRNIGFRLPADWELLQFSRNMEKGRCGAADRHQIRFEWNWKVVEGRPDFDRMLGDYRTRLEEEKKIIGSEAASVAGWQGFTGRLQDDSAMSRFARYFEEEKLLLEVVFLWPVEADAALEREILESIRHVPATPDGLHRWRAFGLDLLAPGDLPPHRFQIEPARVSLIFQKGKDGGRKEEYRRVGMTQEWLRAPLRQWLEKQPGGVIARTTSESAGHLVESATFDLRLPLLHRLRGMKLRQHAETWICPGDNRLYYVAHTRRTKDASTIRQLAGHRLKCCSRLLPQE